MAKQYEMIHQGPISARAPATVSNLAVGFDVLGMAVHAPYDEVTLTPIESSKLVIGSIDAPYDLPKDPQKNTATIALNAMWQAVGWPCGFRVDIVKGIPLGSGLGGSAATAVAALVAANGLISPAMSLDELLAFAVEAEAAVSGSPHADNAAPALWGGLVLCAPGHAVESLPLPAVNLVVQHVDVPVKTARARQCLPKTVSLAQSVATAGRLAYWLQQLHRQDTAALLACMHDDVVQPARAHLWPHYEPLKQAALNSGASAVCISGSGPTLLAWLPAEINSDAVQAAMQAVCVAKGWQGQQWAVSLPAPGAQIIQEASCDITVTS